MIRICGVVRESIVDGPGLRFVLFTQGCLHHCPGCHNPESHALDGGYEVTAEKVLEEFKKNPLLKGITLSGGDPILQAGELVGICREVHAMGKDVMTYTGYTYEELMEMQKTDEGIRQLLEETTGLPVVLWDERRTTIDAHQILMSSGKNAKKRKKVVDAVAASLILEGYLTYLKTHPEG